MAGGHSERHRPGGCRNPRSPPARHSPSPPAAPAFPARRRLGSASSRGTGARPRPRRWLAEAEGPCAAGSGCSSPPERGGGVKPAGAASPCARRADELAPFSPAGYFYPAPLGFAPSFSTSLPGVALRSRSPPGAPAARAGRRLPRAEGTGTWDTAGGWLCRKTPLPAPRLPQLPAPKPHPSTCMALPASIPPAPRSLDSAGRGGISRRRGRAPAASALSRPPTLPTTRSSSSKHLLHPCFAASSFQPVPGGSSAAPRRVSCPGDSVCPSTRPAPLSHSLPAGRRWTTLLLLSFALSRSLSRYP